MLIGYCLVKLYAAFSEYETSPRPGGFIHSGISFSKNAKKAPVKAWVEALLIGVDDTTRARIKRHRKCSIFSRMKLIVKNCF